MVAPELTELATRLGELALQNTASLISSRISTWRTRKDDQQVISELIEQVNSLIAEKAELVSIAQAFEQELSSRRISQDEIVHITQTVMPTLERVIRMTSRDNEAILESVQILKELVSTETLTVLQVLGFNIKEAVGQPLTHVVQRAIASRASEPKASHIVELELRQQIALFELLRDPDASERLRQVQGN